jgi:hypothetical protein
MTIETEPQPNTYEEIQMSSMEDATKVSLFFDKLE